MATTVQNLIDETKRYLMAGSQDEVNRLDGAIASAGATTFTLKYAPTGTSVGSLVSINLELLRIWEINSGNSKIMDVVERGVLGSTAASSHATLSLVEINPKFPNFAIFQALNDELDDLSSPGNGLFQVKSLNITYNSSLRGYNLTSVTDLINIYEIRAESSDGSLNWPVIEEWTLGRNMDTAEFASGFALFLGEPAYNGNPLRVRYTAPFTQFTAVADDIQTVTGLPASANDILPLGAAYRLIVNREGRRGFYEEQGEPRRSEEVPPTAQLQAAGALYQARQRRIDAEAMRLKAQYPIRLNR